MSFPNLELLYDCGWDLQSTCGVAAISAASNIVMGTNPPYTIADFLDWQPAFGGPQTFVSGTLVSASPVLSGATQTGGATAVFAIGQLITGAGIPGGSVILSIDSANPPNLTLTNPATTIGAVSAVLYGNPLISIKLLTMYVALASSVLQQGLWLEYWPMGMALFVAHYATLWAQSNQNPATTLGQLAAAGAVLGFQASRSVGPVSYSQQPLMASGWDDWGALNLTAAGQRLITIASSLGVGWSWVY